MLMLSLLADENFGHRILRGLRRVTGTLDVLTVQEVSLRGHKDPEVLAWAAVNGRVLLTHDVQTVPGFAHQRMRAGEPMPGVIVVPKAIGIGVAIADLTYCRRLRDASRLGPVCPLSAASGHDLICGPARQNGTSDRYQMLRTREQQSCQLID